MTLLLRCGLQYKHSEAAGGHNGLDLRRGNDPAPVTGEYSTETYTREVVEILEAHAARDDDTPLFLYFPQQSVHAPQEVPSHYIDRFKDTIPNEARRNYAGMVAALDDSVGNVTAALKATGMWNNTGGWLYALLPAACCLLTAPCSHRVAHTSPDPAL